MKLYIRNKTVYIRYNENYKTYRISTGIQVPDGAVMSNDNMTLMGRDRVSLSINQLLVDLVAKVTPIIYDTDSIENRIDRVRKHISRSQGATANAIMLSVYARRHAVEAETGQLLSSRGTRYSEHSVTGMNSVAMLLEEMSESGHDLDLMSLDCMNVPPEQRQYRARRMNDFVSRLRQVMIQKGFTLLTQKTYMTHLNALLNRFEREYSVRIIRDIKVKNEELPVVALPPDVVKSFLSMEVPGFGDRKLRWAYEVSFVILITSLRVMDALSLTFNDLRVVDGNPMLLGYVNKKTGERTNCPIPWKLYNLLESNYKTFGTVYSLVLNDTINTSTELGNSMRRLFSQVPGTDTPVTITRLNPDGVTYSTHTKPLYEMVKPHMLRKSAITSMLHAGVPDRIVKYTSGHTGNSRSFERYVAYVDKVYNEQMLDYQKRLMG